MPSARAEEFRRAAARLGFERRGRLRGMSAGFIEMGGRLRCRCMAEAKSGRPFFYKILTQLGISLDEFRKLP